MKTILTFLSLLIAMLYVKADSIISTTYVTDTPPLRVITENHPLFKGRTTDPLVEIRYLRKDFLDSLYFQISKESIPTVQKVYVYFRANMCDSLVPVDSIDTHSFNNGVGRLKIPTIFSFEDSISLVLTVKVQPNASLLEKVEGRFTRVRFSELNKAFNLSESISPWNKLHIGSIVRKHRQDGVNTYRIPGIIRTKTGRLIAVYDVRYHSVWDLPGDIDIGMSYSDDDGTTWSEMKIIAHKENTNHVSDGIGDPSILYDKANGKIWVAALWSHGDNGFFGSGSGLTPEETGQLILTNSSDNGKSWSKPISITPQIKNPIWKILFTGPGNGIVTKNNTLVFPAQFRNEEGIPFSTIIYSKDKGRSWHVGTGAVAETTESAVAQMANGDLLLNMRSNKGGFRRLATTSDYGLTWHQLDQDVQTKLIDPICMGSMISFDYNNKNILAFSNPHTQSGRSHLAVQYSVDGGILWPKEWLTPVDNRKFYGYSDLVYMGAGKVGVFYEGTGNLLFTIVEIPNIRTR